MPISSDCTTISQIRDMVQRGEKITAKTRDLLLFNAIINLYDGQEAIKTQITTWTPAFHFYRISMWAITIIGGTLLALAASGKVEILIK